MSSLTTKSTRRSRRGQNKDPEFPNPGDPPKINKKKNTTDETINNQSISSEDASEAAKIEESNNKKNDADEKNDADDPCPYQHYSFTCVSRQTIGFLEIPEGELETIVSKMHHKDICEKINELVEEERQQVKEDPDMGISGNVEKYYEGEVLAMDYAECETPNSPCIEKGEEFSCFCGSCQSYIEQENLFSSELNPFVYDLSKAKQQDTDMLRCYLISLKEEQLEDINVKEELEEEFRNGSGNIHGCWWCESECDSVDEEDEDTI